MTVAGARSLATYLRAAASDSWRFVTEVTQCDVAGCAGNGSVALVGGLLVYKGRAVKSAVGHADVAVRLALGV